MLACLDAADVSAVGRASCLSEGERQFLLRPAFLDASDLHVAAKAQQFVVQIGSHTDPDRCCSSHATCLQIQQRFKLAIELADEPLMPSPLHWLRRHATYANVMSTLCAFVVLGGGTAYAAATIIDGRNIKNETVTGAKVKDGSLSVLDLSAAARKALKGAIGAVGPAGQNGADGAPGAKGHDGAAGAQGPKGDKGDAGDRGPVGLAGATGLTGATGAAGPAGAQGPAGASITDLAELEGKGCTHPDGSTGMVKVTVGTYSGDGISLTCVGGTPAPAPDPTPADQYEANDTMGSATLLPSSGWSTFDAPTNYALQFGRMHGGAGGHATFNGDVTLTPGDVDWYRWNVPCDTGMPGSVEAKAGRWGGNYTDRPLPLTMYDAGGNVVPQGTAFCSGKSAVTPLYFKVSDVGISWTWPEYDPSGGVYGRNYNMYIHPVGWAP